MNARSGRIAPWLDATAYALVLGTGLRTLLESTAVIRATNAVLPQEFPALALVYAWEPWLRTAQAALAAVAAIAAAVALAKAWPEASRGRRAVGVLLALASAASALTFYALPVAAAAVAAQVLGRARFRFEHREPLRRALAAFIRRLDGVDRASFARAAFDLAILGAAVGGLLSAAEGTLYTSRWSGSLFSREDFVWFQAFALANSILYCWLRAGIILALLALLIGGLRRLIGGGRVPAAWGPIALCIVPWAAACAIAHTLLFSVLGHEIASIGLAPTIQLAGLTLALTLGSVAVRNLEAIMADLGPRYEAIPSFRGDLFACLTSVAFVGLGPLAALRRRFVPSRLAAPLASRAFHHAGAIATLSATALALLVFNYPALHDYSAVVAHVYSSVVVIVVFLVACLASHLWRPQGLVVGGLRLAAGGAVVSATALLLFAGAASANTRVILHEYAVINKVFVQHFGNLAYLRRSQVGMQRAEDVELRFHPPGFEVLPADPGVRERTPKDPPPIIAILIDAMRPDRLGAYGYPRPTSPNIDALARDAVVFERAYSASTATACGVRCMLAGGYASRFMLETELPTFYTQDLIDCGYHNFLLTAWDTDYNGISLPSFQRRLTPEQRARVEMQRFENQSDYDSALAAIPAIDALRARAAARPEGERGWFFYLHLTATHFPWVRREHGADFGATESDLYDHCVSYSDAAVGVLLDDLKAKGIYDDAIIVIMADHGTGLMDHGRYAGFFCYEEQIRVPLIIKMPGVASRRVSEPVSLIDVGPTLVNLFRRGEPNRFHGVSLLPLMSGQVERTGRKALFNLCAFNDAYALIYEGRWKFILHRQEGYRQLFDLEQDPQELRNLVAERPDLDERLERLLAAFLWAGRETYNNPYHFKRYTLSE